MKLLKEPGKSKNRNGPKTKERGVKMKRGSGKKKSVYVRLLKRNLRKNKIKDGSRKKEESKKNC